MSVIFFIRYKVKQYTEHFLEKRRDEVNFAADNGFVFLAILINRKHQLVLKHLRF